MTKVVHLDENDRKLILETRQKLDKVTKLMEELLETIEILSDPEIMKNIREGLEDVKAGRVKELPNLKDGDFPPITIKSHKIQITMIHKPSLIRTPQSLA